MTLTFSFSNSTGKMESRKEGERRKGFAVYKSGSFPFTAIDESWEGTETQSQQPPEK